MKRVTTVVTFMLLGILTLFAQSNDPEENPLQGIWQISGKAPNGIDMASGPILKIITPERTFTNLQLNVGENRKSSILISGNYEILSDSVYTENIQFSATPPFTKTSKNEIKFKLLSDNLLQLRFKVPGQSKLFEEYWVRVTQ